jgi:outer membrane protein assembly factor BamB/predicted Ser/Thr protein kinase
MPGSKLQGDSDADFELARRAVDAGLLSVEQVEQALLSHEKDPTRSLLELLPVPAETLRALRPPGGRALPPEAALAMADSSRRAGAYWISRKLSEGGMGEVFRAWDPRLARWVALKFPKKPESPEARERFAREAALAAGLQHPNVAQVFEVGEIEGKPFLAMQYVDGRTLGEARSAPREQKLRWALDVARALAAAHAAGVIHRDLKPSNAMLDADGRVLVLDFGLAKATEVGGATAGASRIVAGTPNYMAPEQALGRADARSDVYGVGAILYELTTGRPPFTGDNAAEILLQVMERDPAPPRAADPGIPRDAEAVILKCLEKEPARRYATMAELIEDLEAVLRREPLRHARRRTWAYVLGRRIRRQPLLWGLGAASALLVLALAALAIAWYASPGTLRVVLATPGARLWVDGRELGGGESAVEIPLAPGAHEIRATAPDHLAFGKLVLVRRRATETIAVTLAHETGLLDAAADPPSATLEIDGKPHGSRVHALPLDTGRHDVLAWAPGCFERRRALEVRREETTRAAFPLDRGELWRWTSGALHSGVHAEVVPDEDGDGVPELAFGELLEMAVVSGATGTLIRRVAVSDSVTWGLTSFECGGEAGRVVVACALERAGLRLTLIADCGGEKAAEAWEWREPGATEGTPRAGSLALAPDLDGDGAAEILAAGRDAVWVLDVAKRSALRLEATRVRGIYFRSLSVAGSRALYCACEDREGPDRWVAGLAPLDGGAEVWRVEREADDARIFPGPWRPDLVGFEGRGELALLELVWGRETARLPLPAAPAVFSGCDADGDGDVDVFFVLSEGELAACSRADGRRLWSAPGPVSQWWTPARGVVCRAEPDALVATDVLTGRELWRAAGRAEQVLSADLDRDGTPELLVGVAEVGLRALASDGRELWTLRLRGSPMPTGLFPAPDAPRIVFGRGSSFAGLARAPRELWHAEAVGPLIAPAVLARARDGRQVVVAPGDWGDRGTLRAFDGPTGTPLWTLRATRPANDPPGSGDVDGDGDPEILTWLLREPGAPPALGALRLGDGTPLAIHPLPLASDVYATPVLAAPAAATPFLVLNRRQARDVVALDARTGAVLWQRGLGGDSWGGVALRDANRDGTPDVLAPADGQPLRALDGRDGSVLWEIACGEGCRHAPVALDGEGTCAVVANDGELVVFDAVQGRALARAQVADPGSPAPAAGVGAILIARGSQGAQALRWPGLAALWTLDAPCDATPARADLDGDRRDEVVVATRAGDLLFVDAADGSLLWSHALGREGIAAAPVLADLDADGVLDVLVSAKDGRLTVVSGAPTKTARRSVGR